MSDLENLSTMINSYRDLSKFIKDDKFLSYLYLDIQTLTFKNQ